MSRPRVTAKNQLDYIIRYESGELNGEEQLALFGYLIRTGQAWSLQGHYGRTASQMIEHGLINKKGEVQWQVYERAVADIGMAMSG